MTMPNAILIDRRKALSGMLSVSGSILALPLMSSMAGCTSNTPETVTDYIPLLDTLSDLVIPQTDTPGARAAGVANYIDAVITDMFTVEQKITFESGLQRFDALASKEGATDFISANKTIQMKILNTLESAKASNPTRQVWRQIRDMSIFGYYTSELATKELAYEEIPGRYNGCVPFEDVGRAWLDRGV